VGKKKPMRKKTTAKEKGNGGSQQGREKKRARGKPSDLSRLRKPQCLNTEDKKAVLKTLRRMQGGGGPKRKKGGHRGQA